jgi:hypothetical protein
VPSLCVAALGPVITRARVLVHEVTRAEKLAERRRACGANHTELEVEEHRAGHVLSTLGLVAKHVNGVELRVVAAAVLATTADAVLIARHL